MASKTLVRRLRKRFYGNLDSPNLVYRKIVQRYADQAQSIIDVGCGFAAPNLEMIQGEHLLKVGVDVVDEFRTDEAPSVTFVKSSCECIPYPSESFDLAICRSVIEHLPSPEAAFREVSRVLKPAGHLVFLTPNWFDYVSVAASCIPNRVHPLLVHRLTGRQEEDTFPTLYRANTSTSIKRLCRRTGLEVVQLQMLREHPHYLTFNPLPYLCGVVYEKSVQRSVKQLRPWILGVCRRAEEER